MNTYPQDLWPIVHGLNDSGAWPPADERAICRFFEFANQQHLLPLLMADDSLAAPLLAMKPRYRLVTAVHKKRSDQSRSAAAELVRVLGTDRFLFYKGADYRHRLYARPEHRIMGDIDAYVPKSEMNAVLAQLESSGYRRVFSGSSHTHAPGYHEKRVLVRGVLVELHHSFGQRVRAGIDYPAMWRRRERFEFEGLTACRLAPADAILCHAFNLGKDEFTPELNRYLDFHLLLSRHPDQLETCVGRAKAWGIERALFGALHVTCGLFAELRTPAAADCMDQLMDRSTRKFLIERVLPDARTERSGNVLGRRIQIWRKFMLMDRAWRRFAFVGYHMYATGAGALARSLQRKSPANR